MVMASGWGRNRGIAGAMKQMGSNYSNFAFTIAYRYFQLLAFQMAFVSLVSTIKNLLLFHYNYWGNYFMKKYF